MYFLFAGLGVAATVIGIPTLDLTTPEGWVSFWGLVVTVAATLAAVFSLRERFEVLERIAAVVLCAYLLTYTVGAWVLIFSDVGQLFQRGAGAIVLTVMSFVPVVRCLYMLSRVGRAPRLRTHHKPAPPARSGLIILLLLFLTGATAPVAPTSPTGIDLSWLPQALIAFGTIAAIVIGVVNHRRDRVAKNVDMTPPSWPDVYKHQQEQDAKIARLERRDSAAIQLLIQVINQHPADAPTLELDADLVAVLEEDTILPAELRKFRKPRMPRPSAAH